MSISNWASICSFNYSETYSNQLISFMAISDSAYAFIQNQLIQFDESFWNKLIRWKTIRFILQMIETSQNNQIGLRLNVIDQIDLLNLMKRLRLNFLIQKLFIIHCSEKRQIHVIGFTKLKLINAIHLLEAHSSIQWLMWSDLVKLRSTLRKVLDS